VKYIVINEWVIYNLTHLFVSSADAVLSTVEKKVCWINEWKLTFSSLSRLISQDSPRLAL
jgi:hypothetical protein